MFSSIGWGEIVILVVAALVILGPERLPGAMSWVATTMRQVREYATGARQQLKDELGPEFDDLRKPLADLAQLRGMTPRGMITKHLLDGDDSIFTGRFDEKPHSPGNPSTTRPSGTTLPSNTTRPSSTTPPSMTKSGGSNGAPAAGGVGSTSAPLGPDERPPFDADAT